MLSKSLLFILSILSGSIVIATEEMSIGELGRGKLPKITIQHIPQDVTVGIFHFIDYPTLARSRQVCKSWKVLIDEKLPLPQRYILKYLAQFVQKNNLERTIKRFEEIFLAPLSDEFVGKTALDDIIKELQEDLSTTKEQAYQALLSSRLVSTCPSITLEIYTGINLEAKRELAFPYNPTHLMKQGTEHTVEQDVKLIITGQQDSSMQIFGINNLPAKILDRVTEVSLYKINLLKIPRQLQKLSRLAHFGLYGSQLSSIPAEIGQLTKLQKLSLNNDKLSSILPEIGQLTNLQELLLNNNQLSSIPAEIGQLTKLRWLYLYKNQLSSISVEIRQLTDLQGLDLRNNQLSSIPAEIGQLTKLQWLGLENNQLSSIPTEIGQLTSLQTLHLGNNKLSSIPAELMRLTSLQTLYLTNNQLSSIPTEIGQLTSLQTLHLRYNKLSYIPAEIKKALPNCAIKI